MTPLRVAEQDDRGAPTGLPSGHGYDGNRAVLWCIRNQSVISIISVIISGLEARSRLVP